MCGIAGIVRFDAPARAVSEAPIRAALRAMRHRGPDGEGAWFGDRCALGHTRLALIDREGGAQPMLRRGRWAIVFNGEIYNHAELRAQLSDDWQFETRSDVEVVLAAYAAWGEKCLHRFEGMFAFFVWDEQEERGVAARDRLGVKPFVFTRSPNNRFAFASEAKVLLAMARAEGRTAPSADPMSVLEYLVAPSMSGVEHSMFEDIHHLPAGKLYRFSRDGWGSEMWWRYELRADDLSDDAEASAREVREKLERAVKRCLVADVPVGAFLSGGVDSTAIAALAEKPLCFTVRFEGQESYDYSRSMIVGSDDTPFAAMAAKELGLEQVEVPVSRATLAEDLAAISRIDDALPAWEQELAQYHLAKAASGRRKAVLVGDAADETHYGYHFLLDEAVTSGPIELLRRFGSAPVRDDDLMRTLAMKYEDLVDLAGHRWNTPLQRTLATTYLVIKRWLARLLHNGDIHTMAWSVEARVPFADGELLDVARRVDPRVAFANGVEKSVLRRAVKGLIPEAVRARKKSALPKDQGVEAVYRSEVLRLVPDHRDFLEGYLDLDAVEALAGSPRALTESERASLFRTICLCHWREAYGVRAW